MITSKRLFPVDYCLTEVQTWFERDRAHVELRSKDNDQTIIEFWDEAVQEEVEAGYLTLNAMSHRLTDLQKLHQELLELAVDRGFYVPVFERK